MFVINGVYLSTGRRTFVISSPSTDSGQALREFLTPFELRRVLCAATSQNDRTQSHKQTPLNSNPEFSKQVVKFRNMKANQSLIYLANARVPTEKAHGYQIFKTCEAFARQGSEVEFWYPQRENTPAMGAVNDVFAYYGVNTPFQLKAVRCWDWPSLRHVSKHAWALTHGLSFTMQALRLLRQRDDGETGFYTRELWIALRLAKWKRWKRLPNTVIFEAHTYPEGLRRHWMPELKHLDGVVVITRALKDRFVQAGVPSDKVLIAPDGVDLRLYKELPDQKEARRRLKLPLEESLVVYTGHFYPWKGAHELVRSASILPAVHFLLVGGTENDKSRMKKLIRELQVNNVLLTGFKPPLEVPLYLAAADVLVLPNSARQKISKEYTSPLKLFEYMASRRPVIATDLPSLREILKHEENALLVRPDNPKALAEGILEVLNNREKATRLSMRAYEDVTQYTWEKRAQRILEIF